MRFDFTPISFALNGLHPDTPKWGAGFNNRLPTISRVRCKFSVTHFASPLKSNSFSLDPDVKDALGASRAAV